MTCQKVAISRVARVAPQCVCELRKISTSVKILRLTSSSVTLGRGAVSCPRHRSERSREESDGYDFQSSDRFDFKESDRCDFTRFFTGAHPSRVQGCRGCLETSEPGGIPEGGRGPRGTAMLGLGVGTARGRCTHSFLSTSTNSWGSRGEVA